MPAYFINLENHFISKHGVKDIKNFEFSFILNFFPLVYFKNANELYILISKHKVEYFFKSYLTFNTKLKRLFQAKGQKMISNTMHHDNAITKNIEEPLPEGSDGDVRNEKSSISPLKLDPYSSCSSDLPYFCDSRCLSGECFLSAQQTLDNMLKLSPRCRNSSESSTISSTSDFSSKEVRSLVAMNGISNHFLSPEKSRLRIESENGIKDADELDLLTSVSCHSTPKTSPIIKNIVEQETVSITCKSVNIISPEKESAHNLRKRIRKKTCHNCDCSSRNEIIVRSFTQIQHHVSPLKRCLSPVKSKSKSPSPRKSQTVHISDEFTLTDTITSSDKKGSRKKRKKEVDKLYADLREIVWAKNWARDNILSQSCNKRSFTSATYSNSRKLSSTSKTIVKTSLQTFHSINKRSDVNRRCKRSLNFQETEKIEENSLDADSSNLNCNTLISEKSIESSSSILSNENPEADPYCNSISNTDHNTNDSLSDISNSNNNVNCVSTEYSNGPMLLFDTEIDMDPLSVHTHDDISMSTTEKETIIGVSDNSNDSDNSSFALNMSPLSGEDSVGGHSENSNSLKETNSDALLPMSQCDEHLNSQENSISEQLCTSLDEKTVIIGNNDSINEIASYSVEENSSRDNIIACVSTEQLDVTLKQSTESLLLCNEIQNSLNEENSIFYTNNENNVMPANFVIEEEITSIVTEDLDCIRSDSFDLPVLTASEPVVENLQEDCSPPSLEPCVDVNNIEPCCSPYDMVVFRNDINEIEVEIPSVDTDASCSSSEDLFINATHKISEDLKTLNDNLISEDVISDSKEEVPHIYNTIPIINNFKSIKKSKNHCLRRKLLQKYLKLLKIKELPNLETKLSYSIKKRKLKLCRENEISIENTDIKSEDSIDDDQTNSLLRSAENSLTLRNLPENIMDQLEDPPKPLSVAICQPNTMQTVIVSSDGSSSDTSDVESISGRRLDTFQEIRISTQISPMKNSMLSFLQSSSIYSEFHKKNNVLQVNKVTKKRHLQITQASAEETKVKDCASIDGSSVGKIKKLKSEDSRTPYVTFHYGYITVKTNECFTKVIMKHTRGGPNIFLSVKALSELIDILNSAMEDVNCRVLILIGTGCCFCSGIDLQPLIGEKRKEAAKELSQAIKKFVETLSSFHKPLVSVVNGKAVGFGVTLLTYSDVILASEDATFSMPYNDLGYFPEGAATLMLPRVVGPAVAMDMMLRGRVLTAQEAKDCRLVSEVVDSETLVQGLVSKVKCLEGNSLAAMESTKCMVRMHFYQSLQVSLENELEMLPKQWLSQMCQKALHAADQKGLI